MYLHGCGDTWVTRNIPDNFAGVVHPEDAQLSIGGREAPLSPILDEGERVIPGH